MFRLLILFLCLFVSFSNYSLEVYIKLDDCDTCTNYLIEKLTKVESKMRERINVFTFSKHNGVESIDFSAIEFKYDLTPLTTSQIDEISKLIERPISTSFILVKNKETITDFIPLNSSYLKNIDYIFNSLKLNLK